MTQPPADLSRITAAILAGGLGTRLKSVVADRPKVLAEVNGRPFLSYLLDQLLIAGIEQVVICTGHMAHHIEKEFGSSYGHLSLVYSEEKTPLGTAGALKNAEECIKSDFVLVMNGDSYCDVNISDFWSWHYVNRAAGSLLLVKVPEANRHGSIQTDVNNKIIEFKEKNEQNTEGWINAGIYMLKIELIKSIPKNRAVSIEREMFPLWIKEGLRGYRHTGVFIDIGIPEDLKKACFLLQ